METTVGSTLKAPVAKVAASPETPVSKYPEGRCQFCGKPVLKTDDNGFGSTCHDHQGKLRLGARTADKAPEGYLRMSKVCRALEALNFTTSEIVKACGGDATTEPAIHPLFQPVYVGRAKWLHPDILTKGPDILRNHKKAPVAKSAPASSPATVSAVASALKVAAKK